MFCQLNDKRYVRIPPPLQTQTQLYQNKEPTSKSACSTNSTTTTKHLLYWNKILTETSEHLTCRMAVVNYVDLRDQFEADILNTTGTFGVEKSLTYKAYIEISKIQREQQIDGNRKVRARKITVKLTVKFYLLV